MPKMTPRILVIDDTFGRSLASTPNVDRENLCAHFLWQDASGDASAKASKQSVFQPSAEAVFCRAQSPTCSELGDTVENNLESALDAVRRGWPETSRKRRSSPQKSHTPRWSMVLIDLCFYTGRVTEESHHRTPGMPEGRLSDDNTRAYFGLTLLDVIHREFPELPVFMLSSKPRGEVSLEFSRRGALGFIDRSALDGPELFEQALWNHGLLADPTGSVVGQSLPVLLALREARRAAGTAQNVLIRGERGVGKELMTRYLHWARSDRAGSDTRVADTRDLKVPFATVNSAVFTPNLFASELFGIEPRTATGVDGKVGLIEMADGGDLFLDEIGDMPPEIQAAMLRVLQERQITRVGARKSKEVKVRFISATNVDLNAPESGFRPDLLDRLRTGGTIWIPPLRERPQDIPLLVESFIREAEANRVGAHRRDITPDALEALQAHSWPGNVRELRSAIFDAVGRHPDVEHLVPAHLRLAEESPEPSRKDIATLRAGTDAISQASGNLGVLMKQMEALSFNSLRVGEWAGRLDELQSLQSHFAARLFAAALEATKRRTPENPHGAIQIHPAMKLASGDSSLTASQAADRIKRLLAPIQEALSGDLKEAHEVALRLRPRGNPRRAGEPVGAE
jgi:DNA-binding NtrC family response regulator